MMDWIVNCKRLDFKLYMQAYLFCLIQYYLEELEGCRKKSGISNTLCVCWVTYLFLQFSL